MNFSHSDTGNPILDPFNFTSSREGGAKRLLSFCEGEGVDDGDCEGEGEGEGEGEEDFVTMSVTVFVTIPRFDCNAFLAASVLDF